MTNGLSTGFPVSPERNLVCWPGILPAVILAALAVSPAYAAADAPMHLAQATADTPKPVEKPAEAAADRPADMPAEVKPAASEPASKPVTVEPASEPATETAETPAESTPEPAAKAAEAPAEKPTEEPSEKTTTATVNEPPPAEGLPGYPPILRSQADMPGPVRKTWTALRDAALRGDIEALQPLIEAQPSPPTFAFDEIDKPILYLKSLSGDAEGREILAILLEVLQSGFVLADPDSPEAMYLWPYFARHPLEKLTPEQIVEMFTLLTAGDYQDMLSYGAYIFFRVGISPDGTWHFFVAGD